MKRLLSFFLAVTTAAAAGAQVLSVEGPRTRVPQYGRADFSIVLQGTWNNPYLQEEVTLDMVLTAPSGKTLTLPCFFVEGKSGAESRWAARFTPQEQGRYSYVFRYAEHGRPVSESPQGGFEAGKPAGHGILHPRDNWTLAFDDGTPFRGVAENICWESRDSDDSKFFSDLHEQADRYNYDVMLPQFAGAGGNFCRMWMCSWNFPIDRHDRFNNRRYQPSDEYFNPSATARLDHTVELAESLGKIDQPWTFVLSTHMPALPPILIRAMICADKEGFEAVAVESEGKLRDFPLLLRTDQARYDMELASKNGVQSAAQALKHRPVRIIRLEDLEGHQR